MPSPNNGMPVTSGRDVRPISDAPATMHASRERGAAWNKFCEMDSTPLEPETIRPGISCELLLTKVVLKLRAQFIRIQDLVGKHQFVTCPVVLTFLESSAIRL